MTRKDYMNGTVTHREFYASVAKEAGIRFSASDELVKRASNSADDNYNDIPLAVWDSLGVFSRASIARALKAHEDFYSIAGSVCTLKEAVRQAVERLAQSSTDEP